MRALVEELRVLALDGPEVADATGTGDQTFSGSVAAGAALGDETYPSRRLGFTVYGTRARYEDRTAEARSPD